MVLSTKLIKRSEIPNLLFDEFKKEVIKKRVLNFFEHNNFLYAILSDDSTLQISAIKTGVYKEFPSITPEKPSLMMFEREIYETSGVVPINHPFLKPVRNLKKYEFLKSDDYQSHEVGVGPVHAGIIEPGHFRFLCNGERVNHLEISLGYQHKGIEKMMKEKPSVFLAENIAGDTTIGHSYTYLKIMEELSGIVVPKKEQIIRKIALEMERMAIHTGDLGAIAGDVAYQTASSILAVTRTLVINTFLEICGNRFAKGFLKLGGVNFDIDENLQGKILIMLANVIERVETAADAMFSHATVLSRLEGTGIVSNKRAKEIGMTGPSARASGVNTDSRIYEYENFDIKTLKTGDVYARSYIRYLEIKESAKIIRKLLQKLNGTIDERRYDLCLASNSLCVSITEGWRGEICHSVLTDNNGFIEKYKIKDPSFNNWFALMLAVRNNQISDFPVCNKSFNLSYSGFDL